MHVVLFDIDGTLISTGGAGLLAFERAFAEHFDVPAINGQVQFSGRTDRAIVADLFQVHGVVDSAVNWRLFLTGYFAHLPATLTVCRGRVLPGVADLLAELAARPDVAVGLLTGNVREGGLLKLAHYGIQEYFPFGGFGDVHTDRSLVATAAVRAAREHLGQIDGDPRFTVVGDTPHDVACGHWVGARVVGVATGGSRADELSAAGAELVLDDFSRPEAFWEFLDA